MGAFATISKWLLILFNCLFFLVGIALLAVGLYVIFSPYSLEILAVLDNAIISAGAYFIIALGFLVFLIAGFGMCGACCKSKILLGLYILILFLIIATQIAVCAVVIAYRGYVDSYVSTNLEDTMNSYVGETDTDKYSVGWNSIQIYLECCGTDNYTDWSNTTWYASATDKTVPNAAYPISCCAVEDNTAVITGEISNSSFVNVSGCYGLDGSTIPNSAMAGSGGGCYQAFVDYVIANSILIGAVGLGMVAFELLLFLFAFVACCTMEKDEGVA